MKMTKGVSYFPVTAAEQVLLARVREPDLAGRAEELLAMLELIAEAAVSAADLDVALQLLVASRQGEALEARFENLEARLKERIERGLTEIEGRFSRRLVTDVGPAVLAPLATDDPPRPPEMVETRVGPRDLPKDASVAFRIAGDLIWGKTATQFYVGVWRWLFEHGKVGLADLPIVGGSRFVAARSPVHPSGKAFTRSEEVVPGAFVEVNLSRGDILRRSKRYLEQHGVAYEVVVGSE